MSALPIILDGLLKPDGTLEFDAPPGLPSGRVRVTLEFVEERRDLMERLPDAPWADDNIPAPFDLPRPGVIELVQPRFVAERLPEPADLIPKDGG